MSPNSVSTRHVRLTVSAVHERVAPPWMPWTLVAFLAGLGAAIAGWLLCAAICVIGWFSETSASFTSVLEAGTQIWLLAHRVPATFDSLTISLPPLGVTAFEVLICALIGSFSFRTALARNELSSHSGEIPTMTDSGRLLTVPLTPTGERAAKGSPEVVSRNLTLKILPQIVVLSTAGYLVITLTAILFSGKTNAALAGGLMSVGIAVIGTMLGSRKSWIAAVFSPLGKRMLCGIGSGLLSITILGALVLVFGVASGWNRMESIEATLGLDAIGLLVWVLVIIGWLPNLLFATSSFGLGAGFDIGTDSHVTFISTQLGLLPANPVFGALPEPGVANSWVALILVSGVVIGAVVAVIAIEKSAELSLVKTILVSALAGILTAAIFIALAAVGHGNLGTERMVGVGARLPDLLMLVPVIVTVSSAITALIRWFINVRHIETGATDEGTKTIKLEAHPEEMTIQSETQTTKLETPPEETTTPTETQTTKLDLPLVPVETLPILGAHSQTAEIDPDIDASFGSNINLATDADIDHGINPDTDANIDSDINPDTVPNINPEKTQPI